ncbi:uncharacterized protein [Panulirus ornatus]|uniref:uncharacterized protein isoform X2 n=1 Tax=Panulirus ornatus TaxID=150431 RepID=UPI003A83C5CA
MLVPHLFCWEKKGFLIHDLCGLPTPGASEDMMNITAVASHPGYRVLNVSATGCKENKYYTVIVRSCHDGNWVINKERTCENLMRGTLICFIAKEECVTVHSDGWSSNNVMFKNLTEPEDEVHYSTNWSRPWHSSISSISVARYKTAVIYEMVLTPITRKGDDNKEPCLSTEKVTLGEVMYPNLTFSADWNQLDKRCIYNAVVTPRNYCGDDMSTPWRVSPLHYTSFKSEVELEESTKMIPVVISVIIVVLILSLISLLWFCKARRLQNNASVNKKPATVEEPLAGMALLSKRTVLVVYAMDVKKKVADLITFLKKDTSNQILDLYDHTDGNKLADPLVWLTNKFHDPFTCIIIVASRGAKRLQELHNSTVPSDCNLCGQTDDEIIRQEREEVFHFLLIDVLHKLKDSHLNQDYTRFFHVKFIDIPNQVELDYVTPDCVYQLPRHNSRLINALNQP